MKKALIDPRFSVKHISSWKQIEDNQSSVTPLYEPVFSQIENSARICQIEDNELSVTPPLFWTDCNDDVIPETFYYDMEKQTIELVQNEPRPIIFESFSNEP